MTYRIFHYETQAKAKAAAELVKKAGKVATVYQYKDMWAVEFMVIED